MNVEHNAKHRQFEVRDGGELAFLSYRMEDGAMSLEHTRVPQSFEGRGIASALAKSAFDYARSNDLRVVVICPFVQKWLDKHPEQRDIVL
ncbi:MAG TPA: GNAT family N-acetyltransferase [Thermoanaerobaculia bacterium]|nr:GNAT family N-acetyltransferase [Thermoanaerobaculia bacterium]